MLMIQIWSIAEMLNRPQSTLSKVDLILDWVSGDLWNTHGLNSQSKKSNDKLSSYFLMGKAGRKELKGKYHENLMSFENPKPLPVNRNKKIIV